MKSPPIIKTIQSVLNLSPLNRNQSINRMWNMNGSLDEDHLKIAKEEHLDAVKHTPLGGAGVVEEVNRRANLEFGYTLLSYIFTVGPNVPIKEGDILRAFGGIVPTSESTHLLNEMTAKLRAEKSLIERNSSNKER